MQVNGANNLNLDITPPISKSYAHRLIFASYLAGQLSDEWVSNDDTMATYNALCNIEKGADIIDVKESGTTLRFLLPYACTLDRRITFIGGDSLKGRPIKELVDCLKRMGAKIDGDSLPITINGGLHSGIFEIDGNITSQYVSGLLFALPILKGNSTIVIKGALSSLQYVKMTLDVLEKCGIKVSSTYSRRDIAFGINGRQQYNYNYIDCEKDWSSASYILCAGALVGRARVKGLRLDSLQADKKIVEVLKQMNANVEIDGDIITTKSSLRAIDVDIDDCIDLSPIIAVLMANANGVSHINNISRLRLKESDRAKSVVDMLTAFNIECYIQDDAITIVGGKVDGGKYCSFDHRMVMSAYILSLCANGNSEIGVESCVAKSYPKFFEDIVG